VAQDVDKLVRDRPALAAASELCSLQDEIESFNDVGMKGIHRAQNTLSFKWLSFVKNYIEGLLWIAVKYRPASSNKVGGNGFLVLLNGQRHTGNSVPCFTPQFVSDLNLIRDDHISCCWNENMVLIGDVQKMQSVETQLPAFVRLYLINDNVNDCVRRRQSLEFLSIDGTFKRMPVLVEREECISSDGVPICLDHNAISVVESGPEIMQHIAKDGRRMFEEKRVRPGALPLQKLIIALGTQSLYAVRDVIFENSFEAVDVMFGPFYL
jgi:hypothetical protein